jgi:hypothetical protein
MAMIEVIAALIVALFFVAALWVYELRLNRRERRVYLADFLRVNRKLFQAKIVLEKHRVHHLHAFEAEKGAVLDEAGVIRLLCYVPGCLYLSDCHQITITRIEEMN